MEKMKIAFVGSGNVATHLAMAFYGKGHHIRHIIGRNLDNAQQLAGRVGAMAGCDLALLDDGLDLVVIAVSDRSVADVAAQLPGIRAIVAHTAGSVPMEVLSRFANHGVFYPFQTFSKEKEVDMAQVPFLIEAGNDATARRLKTLAGQLGPTVMDGTSAQRMQLHIAAVFACNFANHLYVEAHRLLTDNGLPFELLYPLIDETSAKVKQMLPRAAQTGPAVRHDADVVEKHLSVLADRPATQELYRLLSRCIGQWE